MVNIDYSDCKTTLLFTETSIHHKKAVFQRDVL